MKKILFILTILVFCISQFFADENTEVKFPGKIGLEFLQRVDYQSDEGFSEGGMGTDNGDALYTRTELKAQIAFPISIYTITPSIKDRFEMRLNFRDEDATEDKVDTVNFRGRNRLYFGLGNTIAIKDVININLDFEFRIESDLKPEKNVNPLSLRFSPVFGLGGKYNFGLSWSIVEYFELSFDPTARAKDALNTIGFEGFYNLQFEFFHFFAPKDIKGSFMVDNWMLVELKNWKKETAATINNDLFIGFTFDIFKVTPMIGYFMWFTGNKIAPKVDIDTNVGLKVGIGFSKDWFSFSLAYIGGLNVEVDDPTWKSDVATAVKFKL